MTSPRRNGGLCVRFRPKAWILSPVRKIQSFRNTVVICAVFKNESAGLHEWLDFHHRAGVTKVVLYDDASTDGWRDVLEPWIARGFVELGSLKIRSQTWAYDDCLRRYRWNFQWFAFIDIDEFLFPGDNSQLPDMLGQYSRWAGVFVFWELFGANGRESTVPSNIVRSNIKSLPLPVTVEDRQSQDALYKAVKGNSKMSGRPFHGKSIVQGWRTWKMDNHLPRICLGSVVDEQQRQIPRTIMGLPPNYIPTNKNLKLHHYWAKSHAHLVIRATHRNLSGAAPAELERYERWEAQLNAVTNRAAVDYRNQNSQPFVFIIGFNKTGTRSLHHLFLRNGFPAIHWGAGKVAVKMSENITMGWPILTGFDIEYRAFSDLTHVEETFYIEANRWFRTLDRDYPGSYFILNTRPLDSWILSRSQHDQGRFLREHMSSRGTPSKKATIAQWTHEREAFHAEVRQYFAHSSRFLEIDIEAGGVVEAISEFLNITIAPKSWQHHGKT